MIEVRYMGSWGVGLWDSDIALDIKNEYAICLRYSYDDDDALQRFMHRNEKILSDSDDGPIAIMILAKQMWQYGRLTEDVKKMAFKAVENDLKNWEYGDSILYEKRKKQLEKYKKNLYLPQPDKKSIKRMKPFENHWIKGDVLAIKYKGKCKIRERENCNSQIYSGGYILLMFDKMEGNNPIFYTMFARVDNVYAGMDISGFPYIQYFKRSDSNGEMVHRVGLVIYGADQERKLKYLGNYLNQQPPINDDKEMTCIIPFDILASYAVTSYFHINEHYEESKELC